MASAWCSRCAGAATGARKEAGQTAGGGNGGRAPYGALQSGHHHLAVGFCTVGRCPLRTPTAPSRPRPSPLLPPCQWPAAVPRRRVCVCAVWRGSEPRHHGGGPGQGALPGGGSEVCVCGRGVGGMKMGARVRRQVWLVSRTAGLGRAVAAFMPALWLLHAHLRPPRPCPPCPRPLPQHGADPLPRPVWRQAGPDAGEERHEGAAGGWVGLRGALLQ